MFMSSNYQRQYQKEYEKLVSEVGDLKIINKNLTSTIATLYGTINTMSITNEKKDEQIKSLSLKLNV